jgi:hypothetical protein
MRARRFRLPKSRPKASKVRDISWQMPSARFHLRYRSFTGRSSFPPDLFLGASPKRRRAACSVAAIAGGPALKARQKSVSETPFEDGLRELEPQPGCEMEKRHLALELQALPSTGCPLLSGLLAAVRFRCSHPLIASLENAT